jgi:hypothetical protein
VNYVNQIGLLWIGEWKRHLVPFKEQARPMEKENAIWSTYMDEKQIG